MNEFAKQFCERNVEITKRKNADYTGNRGVFYNFERVKIYGVDPRHGFITRMVDKISRIETFLMGHNLRVTDESGMDTLHDLANYAMLFQGYLKGITNLTNHAEVFYARVQSNLSAGGQRGSIEKVKNLLSLVAINLDIKASQHHLLSIAQQALLLAYEATN